MEQRISLTQPIRARALRSELYGRWVRSFFSTDRSPGQLELIDVQRRAVWIGLALVCQSLVVIAPDVILSQPWYAPLMALFKALLPGGLTIGGFFALWRAIKPASFRQKLDFACSHGAGAHQRALVRTFLLLVIGCFVFLSIVIQCFLPPNYSNDGTSLDTNAAVLLLKGENPYMNSNILAVARRFHIQPGWTTPLRSGQFAGRLDYPTPVDFLSTFDTALKTGRAPEFESRVSYPALAFLTLVPFVFLHLHNVLPFYLLSYLLLVWVAWRSICSELKPWLLLLALANIPMLSATLGGSLDVFYSLLLVLAWLLRDKRWLSALFLGLALASKQLAWFFVPFYLLLIWREVNLREALRRVVIAGLVALAINLPFIVWNPGAWLTGVLAPVADPMFPLGVGFINLSSVHVLPYLPSDIYLGLEMGLMAVMLVCYWRICHHCPEAVMLLAVVPLFLAWRSLPSYFSCTAFPLFILMAARLKRPTRYLA